MQAEIITIGDEILIGHTLDTNSQWIANQLESIGVKVYQITSISDDKKHILSSLDCALNSCDLVILTGGLGPTNDDITKHTLCEYFDDELIFSDEVFSDIKALFAKHGRRINFHNKRQAMVPANCKLIRNSIGTAPAMFFNKNGKLIVSFPGVPYEMKHLMKKFLNFFKQQFKLPFVIHKLLLIRGIVESHLAELIQAWEEALPNVIKLAYLPSRGVIKLRLTARGNNEIILRNTIDQQIEKLREVAGEYFCPFQESKIECIVAELLKLNKAKLGTAESCTGGKIAHRITSVAGSSIFFKGAIIAYSEDVKISELGVKSTTIANHHIVSEEVVVEMAQGLKNKLKVDYALATSGIAGPSGAEEDISIGTVCVALATPYNTLVETFYLNGSREEVIDKATEKALLILKETLENN